jgi:hypothetical protein
VRKIRYFERFRSFLQFFIAPALIFSLRLAPFSFVELPPEWVRAERDAAEKHKYRQAFRESFAKITGSKPMLHFHLAAS